MADEPRLRHLFGETPQSAIDVSSVIRRSRARRAPRILGAGALSVLAASTLVYAGFAGLSGLSNSTASDAGGAAPAAESRAEEDFSSMEGGAFSAKGQDVSSCGSPVVEIPPSETGLELSVAFPAVAEATTTSIDGIVTMTNTGSAAIRGTSSLSPTVTLSTGDVVVWHTGGRDLMAVSFSLAPGESVEFDASFSPVVCEAGDDANGSLATDLPPAPPGGYALTAAIDVVVGDRVSTIGGPSQAITLR